MHHIKLYMSSSTFHMKSVDDNIAFLECTFPTCHIFSNVLDVKKLQMLQKFRSGWLYHQVCGTKHLVSLSANASCIRLITFNFKIDVGQSVSMMDSLYKYAVTNQKGCDIPLLCKNFILLGPCTFDTGVHYLELVKAAF